MPCFKTTRVCSDDVSCDCCQVSIRTDNHRFGHKQGVLAANTLDAGQAVANRALNSDVFYKNDNKKNLDKVQGEFNKRFPGL